MAVRRWVRSGCSEIKQLNLRTSWCRILLHWCWCVKGAQVWFKTLCLWIYMRLVLSLRKFWIKKSNSRKHSTKQFHAIWYSCAGTLILPVNTDETFPWLLHKCNNAMDIFAKNQELEFVNFIRRLVTLYLISLMHALTFCQANPLGVWRDIVGTKLGTMCLTELTEVQTNGIIVIKQMAIAWLWEHNTC